MPQCYFSAFEKELKVIPRIWTAQGHVEKVCGCLKRAKAEPAVIQQCICVAETWKAKLDGLGEFLLISLHLHQSMRFMGHVHTGLSLSNPMQWLRTIVRHWKGVRGQRELQMNISDARYPHVWGRNMQAGPLSVISACVGGRGDADWTGYMGIHSWLSTHPVLCSNHFKQGTRWERSQTFPSLPFGVNPA